MCTRRSPLKRTLRRLWAMCERSLRILFRQRRNESYRGKFFLLTMPCFGDCSPLFTRSIKAQTGYVFVKQRFRLGYTVHRPCCLS